MKLPVLNGVIDRRILLNYKVLPGIAAKLLPSGLEPIVINGYASAGICLLRLKNIGVRGTPSCARISSENAAHRFLVRSTESGKVAYGVYIPRRDTDSVLNVVLAGQMFSWPHYHASFQTEESNGRYHVTMKSNDGHATVEVRARIAETFPSASMFRSLDDASATFCKSSTGLSPSRTGGKLKSIRLQTRTWQVKPLEVEHLYSSYFEDRTVFPEGSIQFDNGLLMEGIEHEWLPND